MMTDAMDRARARSGIGSGRLRESASVCGGRRRGVRGSGFTLIELMVVIAIIGVLAVLITASARSGMMRSESVKCLSNMRQMGVAVQLYASDNNGMLPGTSHGVSWTNSLAAYLGEHFIGRCPSVANHRSRVTYAWNDCLALDGNGLHVAACRTPSQTLCIAELALTQASEHFHFAGVRGGASRLTPNQFKGEVNVEAHGDGSNYLFVDGHAENLTWTEAQRRLTQQNSTFVVP